MKNLMKSPIVNAVCISIFSLFYALVFFIYLTSQRFKILMYSNKEDLSFLMKKWKDFLLSDQHVYVGVVLLLLTIVIVILLLSRHRPYDEYHTTILTQYLVVSLILTLMAIAIFYLMILWNPDWILEKFTLFIVIHWTTVVLSDLVFILICRWR